MNYCGAQKRQGEPGDTCRRPAGWGTPHAGNGRCKLHGGSTVAHRKQAERIRVDGEIRDVLAKLDVAPIANPLTALSRVAGQIVAWQEALAPLVNALGDDVRYEGATGAEQLRAEVVMYERAMDRSGKILADIARLDIDARLVRIEEEKARVLMDAVQAGLAAINVTGEQAAKVKRVMARHLRAVE
ncbi:hypothetical protein OG689_10970 [Kitasatospora sp. NBC_00240]|uniref:hypothetical protein n=1 Tax=Kitasatospora sp. NBC_00240 TaxID=2903567 RepID=UPI002253E6B0|nr:hypothetical protein [Kitasatospora sp. NBC_00240]MCX5209806.1 hypothetical protein [Kitasatospora sp. NBC_00240]